MRKVRSFVLREGRLTEAQRRALSELWPRFGVEGAGPLEIEALFGRQGPVLLEIGFGDGEALLETARRHPDWNLLGIEVYRPGIGKLLRRLAEEGIENVRILRGDAAELLAERIPDRTLDQVWILFPDPWPKKRHHKRRLIQPPFVEQLSRKLKEGGVLLLATDWPDYAAWMEEVIQEAGSLLPIPPPPRPKTKYERRARELGHPIFELAYRLTPQKPPARSAAAAPRPS